MKQFIGFQVDSGEYMIPILKVREIITMPAVTGLPHVPAYVKGVTNIRGSIVPIISMQTLLAPLSKEGEGKAVIVLVSGKLTFGIIVDGITGVINARDSDIEPPDNFVHKNVSIEGLAKVKGKLIALLDTKKLIPVDDLSLLEDAIIEVKETVDGNEVEITREIDTIGGKMLVRELCNAREYFNRKNDKDPRMFKVYDQMIKFMEALAEGSYTELDDIAEGLSGELDSDLFREVGKITRNIHDSLESFKQSIDTGLQKLTRDNGPSAVDNLQLVMAKTEEAANKTMGIVERYFEESSELSRNINRVRGDDEAVEYLNLFKEALDHDMTSILTAQQFQDITGQTIKKVIDMVAQVEGELIRLIKKFGMPVTSDRKKVTFLNVSDGRSSPEIEDKSIQKVSQSDVEGLLKDFGF